MPTESGAASLGLHDREASSSGRPGAPYLTATRVAHGNHPAEVDDHHQAILLPEGAGITRRLTSASRSGSNMVVSNKLLLPVKTFLPSRFCVTVASFEVDQ